MYGFRDNNCNAVGFGFEKEKEKSAQENGFFVGREQQTVVHETAMM